MMKSLSQAIKVLKEQSTLQMIEKTELEDCLFRILAKDVLAESDFPAFSRSAMDGFACKKSDLGKTLEIIEFIAAGKKPVKQVGDGQCAKIMTGAMIPAGADLVVMSEDSQITGANHVILSPQAGKDNIRKQGEDLKQGDVILAKGTIIKPNHIPLLCLAGTTNPVVFSRPVVSVISTGDELVEPGEKPVIPQIRNTNAAQILAQLQSISINGNYFGIVKDNESVLFEKLPEIIDHSDIFIISGGVSVGDYDLVPQVIEKLGFTILFHGLKVKPGKRTLFASRAGKFIFGLPGNPVSSLIQFELLVKPFVFHLMNGDFRSPVLKYPIAERFLRKKGMVTEFFPVRILDNGFCSAIDYHGSEHLAAYSAADGFLEIPEGIVVIEKGELVNVRLI